MTVQNKKSGTEVAQTMAQTDPQKIRRVGRSHVDYWTPRLKKRSYLDREGRLAEIPEWQVRIAHLGRRDSRTAAGRAGRVVASGGVTRGRLRIADRVGATLVGAGELGVQRLRNRAHQQHSRAGEAREPEHPQRVTNAEIP